MWTILSTVPHLFLQGILAAVCPDFLRIKPHPDLHIQTPQWWHWLLQQRMQRVGLLFNNWHCGIIFWASHCASPQYHSKFSLPMWIPMSYVGIFVLHCILRDAQCASCAFVKANRRLWNYLGQKTDSVSIFFSYRLSGVPAAWSWQEMLSSSSPSLAFLLCLEEGTISAGSSGRVPVDSGQREREMDRWMDGWVGR